MSGRSCRVFLSSAGRRVQLLRILREAQARLDLEPWVGALDAQRAAPAWQLADAGFLVPRLSDPGFVDAVLDLCERHDVRVVVPTIDTELPIYAAARDRFEERGITVAVSSPEAVRVANDKHATHAFLSGIGAPVPRQATAAEVLADPGRWTFPLFAKPSAGSRSVGASRVEDAEELRHLVGDRDYVVQSLATGHEYTVDVWVDRAGRCACCVPRRRLEVRSGEVSKGMTVRSAPVREVVRRVVEALPGARGPLCVQVFLDEATSTTTVIEINARFGGGFPLSWAAGASLPQWLLEEALGAPSSASDEWRAGLVMLRFDDAVYLDAADLGLG